jgi:hypothetical protein
LGGCEEDCVEVPEKRERRKIDREEIFCSLGGYDFASFLPTVREVDTEDEAWIMPHPRAINSSFLAILLQPETRISLV